MRTFYKLGIVLVNRYVGKDVVLRFIGYFNRRFQFMNTVFVAYPATEEFTKAYGFERTLHLSKWNPWITGLFLQNGKVGLMTCITNLEHEFLSADSSERLKSLVAETERIRHLSAHRRRHLRASCPVCFMQSACSPIRTKQA